MAKVYKNIEGISDLSVNESMFTAISDEIRKTYPNTSSENISIIADIMIRYDEDVIEISDGFYLPKSEYFSK